MTQHETQGEKDYLGVRDLRLVHTLLQVAISWGLYPYFSPGVGVPLSNRVKSGFTNHELFTTEDHDQHSHHLTSDRRLFQNITKLVDTIAKSHPTLHGKRGTTVASILLQRHLPDLYAGLLQLAYEPSKPSTPQIPGSSTPSSTPVLNPSSLLDVAAAQTPAPNNQPLHPNEKSKCAHMFMWLFDRSDSYRAMESLMLLLGTSPLHPVPAWLRSICGRFLSRLLLKANGVATVLQFTIGMSDHAQLAELEKVTKLVLSVPRQMNSVEAYYAVIAPQLLVLLEKAQRPLTGQDQAVTFILGRMITKYPDVCQKLVVNAVTKALVDGWQRRDYYSSDENHTITALEDPVALNEQQLTSIINAMHTIMVGGEPSPIVIKHIMASCIAPFYHLYEYSCRTKSGNRETVLDLLTTYFRLMTPEQCMDDLQHIVLDPVDLHGDRVAYFGPSNHGGVELRWKRSPKRLGGNELPLDISRLVDFLTKLNNPDLSGDFFVFLLNSYSHMQAAGPSSDPKSILMILQLIMVMVDKLGPAILGKPIQILAFANNTVVGQLERMDRLGRANQASSSSHRGFPDITNIVSEEQRDLFEEMDDESFTVEDELESLLLAINLIRAVIHENDDLDDKALQLMSSLLPSLKRLEKMADEILQDQIHEVILAITTIQSSQDMKAANGGRLTQSQKQYQEAMKALQDELLPVRAHGIGLLKEMILAKDPLVSSGQALDDLLDLFIRLAQDEDSFIYMNAIKGLSALTDIHGNRIIEKLGKVYADKNEKLDHRLRVGEALLQTIQRCGDALGKYINALVNPLESVLGDRQADAHLRTSALSILSMACQTCPTALSGILWQLTDWVLNILDLEKTPEVRRAATVLILSLFRGMASQTVYDFPTENLRRAYRTLRYIEHNDQDELTRYQARVALSDLDVIMRGEIFHQ
ncbi:hypothetical protein DM01DRAFT_1325961 [Hesseltinella vesiculosa]|uniref:RNA polymerase II assembly factor Rtp1 C-terminal domain-containing protein n=1 Tax=Hesseltinella vesiculosa TaxID=101127 RepID=A0A1X2GAM3_9FUNG|nr:hypothetical protein DM01DRAFT_1325961 [Hesseltinella vesiculosa]